VDTFGIRIPNTAFPTISTLNDYGTDTITDFEIGIDTIRFGWTPFTVLDFATQDGADVRIDYATGSTLILEDTDLTALEAFGEASFVFDSTPVEDPGLL